MIFRTIFLVIILFATNLKTFSQTTSIFFGLPQFDVGSFNSGNDSDHIIYVSTSVNLYGSDTLGFVDGKILVFMMNKVGKVLHTDSIYLPYKYPNGISTENIIKNEKGFTIALRLTDKVKYRNDSTGEMLLFINFDKNGDTISTYTSDLFLGSEFPYQIVKTSNGHFQVFGQYCYLPQLKNDCDCFLAEFDSLFTLKKLQLIALNATSFERPGGIYPLENGATLLFYKSYDYMDAKDYLFLSKIDSNGNKLWSKIYFQNLVQSARQILKLRDGNFALLADALITGTGGVKTTKAWIMKVDPLGNKLWEKIYGADRDAWLYSMKEDEKGNLILVGAQVSERLTVSDRDAWIIKLNAQGNKLWERLYNNYNVVEQKHPSDYLLTIDLFPLSGDLFVGGVARRPDTSGRQEMWIMRLDSFGCLVPGCQGVGIDNIRFSNKELLIQPNPAIDFISIQNENAGGVVYYEILNMQGQVIKKAAWSQNKIPLQELAAGQYVLHVQCENELHALGRFVVGK